VVDRRVIAKLVASLALGGVCLWVAVRKVQGGDFVEALSAFDTSYLIPLVLISLAIQVFRAWRWQIELSPLRRLPFFLLWQVVAVAYMMINVLPFRLGEPVRPLLLSWKSNLAVPAIVGNWAFEKMMDSAAMVFYIHLTLLMTDLPDWANRASTGSLTIFFLLLGLVVGFWLRGPAFFDAALGRVLPSTARDWCVRVLSSARDGLQILPDRRLVALVFVVTLLLWALPILSSYVLILAFGLDVPVAAAFVVFVAIGVGTALPNPPGMFGVFQIAAVVALGLFGVDRATALAYGVVLNALQLITLVLQGFVALPFVGVGLGQLTRAAIEEPA
jgi:uncharacterized protein (TIRG00374 family)